VRATFNADVRLLNFCRTGRYQGRGYYVSLVAQARGHRPLPEVKTVEYLKSESYVRELATELEPLVQELRHDESDRFELNVYLGRDPAGRHQALAEQIFAGVRAPLLQALFVRADGRWQARVGPVDQCRRHSPPHRQCLLDAVQAFVAEGSVPEGAAHAQGRAPARDPLDPKEPLKASNEGALQNVPPRRAHGRTRCRAGLPRRVGSACPNSMRSSAARVRRSRHHLRVRAPGRSAGHAGRDDPESILKCVNKVVHARADEPASHPAAAHAHRAPRQRR
jgi:hypothetical protein